MNDDSDARDPLRAAFQDHRRAPADVVPHRHSAADTARLLHEMAGTVVEVTHHELTEHGITQYTECTTVCAPIIERREHQTP